MCGASNPMYVHDILMYMRGHNHHIRVVREVGDAIAHFDKRDRNQEFAQKAATMAALLIRGVRGEGVRLVEDGQAIIERVDFLTDRRIRELSGGSRKELISGMAKALEKLKSENRIHVEDLRIFTIIATTHPMHSHFSQKDVSDGLEKALLKEDILAKSDKRSLREIVYLFSLYYITRAHGCEVNLRDDQVGEFIAGSDGDGLLSLDLSMTVKELPHGMSIPFFSTEMPVKSFVNPGNEPNKSAVAVNKDGGPPIKRENAFWSTPIELVDGKLSALTECAH